MGKAGGINGLLPGVLKCCSGLLLDYISSSCFRLFGKRDACPKSLGLLCWSLCQRKETCLVVTTVETLAFWT